MLSVQEDWKFFKLLKLTSMDEYMRRGRVCVNFTVFVQGGDFTKGDGTGGMSIYGSRFEGGAHDGSSPHHLANHDM
jgi:hypothetical protein